MKHMSFLEQIKPIKGCKVEKVYSKTLKGKKQVVIRFDDEFGQELHFDEKGKFDIIGLSKR